MSSLTRLKYISRFAAPLSHDEIEQLAAASAENNAKLGVTGVLMTAGGFFFQVLEGPADAVAGIFRAIQSDPRHVDVALLTEETGVAHRIFDKWSMGTVSLEDRADPRLEPLRSLLGVLVEQRKMLDELSRTMERLAWNELTRPG